jgi:hypothetical protein
MQPCGKNCPRVEGHGAQKESFLALRNLDVLLFSNFVFCYGFSMMSPSI